MPGEGRADAFRAAHDLQSQGIGTVLTLLGENVVSRDGVQEVVAEYRSLLAELEEARLDAQISVKLTQLGLDLGEEVALEHLVGLVSRAHQVGSFVWIDMEESSFKEATLRVFSEAVGKVGPSEMGLCLQAYLRSTPEDLEKLLPLSPSIRMVKGAYAESPDVAFPNRRAVDEAFFHLGTRILESTGRVAFATHDPKLVEKLRGWIKSHETDGRRYEFQMLFGIGGEEQIRLVGEGEPVRVLISYGPAWFPWYMRRLAERPANIWFVLKNLFR